MKKFQSIALMMAMALSGTVGFSSCSSSDVGDDPVVFDESGNAGVKSEFVISIPRSVVGGTRMESSVTQSNGTVDQFRGIDNIRLIPFAVEPAASATKLSDIMRLSYVSALDKPGVLNYKVYSDQFVPVGTRYFLFYGKAIDNDSPETAITSMEGKFKYGILHAKGLSDGDFTSPSGILFSLEQINTSTEAQVGNTVGKNIVALLTSLANTSVSGVATPNNEWSTTNNVVLASLYKNFISITTGSSATLSVILSKLHASLDYVQSTDAAYSLASALKKKIEEACASALVNGEPAVMKSDYTGYPGFLGLPDGAVRLRWSASGSNFVDETANYGRFRQKITDYVYPAALWYYTSTPLKAASSMKSNEYDDKGNWDGVINTVYASASDEVQAGTQSVALCKPAEYGVGRIETKIQMGDGTFFDGNGKPVGIGNGYRLKGILIGGQNSVGYNFTPKGSENMTIYDRSIENNIIAKAGYTTSVNQTLALETESNQVVYAALELENGGDEFQGLDGVIPAGGIFYLAVALDPTTASNYVSGSLDKIVQQDHVTKLTVTIKNGGTSVDRNGDGKPDVYVKDENGNPIGVDVDGDGVPDPYDIDGDGNPDTFITDPAHGGPGWDTDGDGEVDLPVTPDPETGKYPDGPNVPDGLGSATNGIPDLTSPGMELGTSVNLEWQEGLILNPSI